MAEAALKMLDHRWVSTSKNDVERGESNGTMAGLALRLANAGEERRLCRHRHRDPRARHRGEHGDVLRGEWRAAQSAPVRPTEPARGALFTDSTIFPVLHFLPHLPGLVPRNS